ncbi:patatin-like phospholipase family protein [Elusimicrobiota bacterium]
MINILKESLFFRNLSPSVLEAISRKVRMQTLPKNSTVYERGTPGDKLYIISNGYVTLYATDKTGQEYPIRYLGKGELLGELSILTESPHSVTARTNTSCEFFTLDKKDFETMLSKNPALAMHFSRLLSKRLLSSTEQMAEEDWITKRLSEPRLFVFAAHLEDNKEDIFTLNLALSVSEQTRKRTLLLLIKQDDSFELPKSIRNKLLKVGKTHDILEKRAFKEILESAKTTHSSKLTIINLPIKLFYSMDTHMQVHFANMLRSEYDFTLAFIPLISIEPLSAFCKEANSVFEVHSEIKPPIYSHKFPIHTIMIVDEGMDSFFDQTKIKIGWQKRISKAYGQTKNPFQAIAGTKTMRSIDRLARIITKLKIGIALGSGGALGFTSLGVLRVLEKEKIYPDMIAGTSAGAFLGAMYAKPMNTAEISEVGKMLGRDWLKKNLIWDIGIPGKGGFMGGVIALRLFRSIFDDLEFHHLELPMSCVTCDIMTGEEVVIQDGKVSDAIRASTSIPVIFKPHFHQNRYLVDGGLVNPVPTNTVSQMGADFLISVRLTKSPREKKKSKVIVPDIKTHATAPNLLNVFFNTIVTMSYQVALSKIDVSHVSIHPKIADYSWLDFEHSEELIEIGEEAALEAIPKIKANLPFFSR